MVRENSPARAGSYWTLDKPNSIDEIIGGTAIQPGWNSFEFLFEYKVPQGSTLRVWSGTTARQELANPAIVGHYLPGGSPQIFIDFDTVKGFESKIKNIDKTW